MKGKDSATVNGSKSPSGMVSTLWIKFLYNTIHMNSPHTLGELCPNTIGPQQTQPRQHCHVSVNVIRITGLERMGEILS